MEVVLSRNARELFEQPARTPLDDDYEPWCIDRGVEHLAQVVRADPRARIVLDPTGRGPRRRTGPRGASALLRGAGRGTDARDPRRDPPRALGARPDRDCVRTHARPVPARGQHRQSLDLQNDCRGAVVIGWVVLWAPVAIFGTDIWVLGASRRAYRQVARHELEIR